LAYPEVLCRKTTLGVLPFVCHLWGVFWWQNFKAFSLYVLGMAAWTPSALAVAPRRVSVFPPAGLARAALFFKQVALNVFL